MAANKKYTIPQWVAERLKYYWEKKRSFELTKASFEEDKFEFNECMDRYFDDVADSDGKFIVELEGMVKGTDRIICQKIQQVKVDFNVKKLEKILSKDQRKKVIQKHYQVNNWPGLLQLLKDSGVDWKSFLKFVDVKETVNEKALEQLVELNEVDFESVKSCSKAGVKTRYYKLTEK